jgi:two-component system, NarL family, response regulator LiaR
MTTNEIDPDSSQPIQILIVEDHTVVRDGLRALISAEHGMSVIGTAGDGLEAVAQAEALQPDVILMDLILPRMDGVEATRLIRQKNPSARILILTSFGEDHTIFAAIKAGASGFLMKDSSSEELLIAIRETFLNQTVYQPEIALRLTNQQSSQEIKENELTGREIEILQLVAMGKTNQEIADQLFLSERTVRTHITNILSKLGLTNRTQAALYALKAGISHIDYSLPGDS